MIRKNRKRKGYQQGGGSFERRYVPSDQNRSEDRKKYVLMLEYQRKARIWLTNKKLQKCLEKVVLDAYKKAVKEEKSSSHESQWKQVFLSETGSLKMKNPIAFLLFFN